MGYTCKYKLINKKGVVVSDYPTEACYSRIMSSKVDESVSKIVVYHPVELTPYTEKECAEWIKIISELGFTVKYKGANSKIYKTPLNHHVFIIDISKGNNEQRAYCLSTLTLIRYLYEEFLCKIPKKYMTLLKKYKLTSKDDKFQLIGYCHRFVEANGNSNHALQSCFYKKYRSISLSTFEHRIKEFKKFNMYVQKRISLHELWKGRLLGKSAGKTFSTSKEINYMNVFVVGGNVGYVNWLPIEVKIVDNVKKAELVVFTGGEDVHPSLYGDVLGKNTECNIERDKEEKKVFLEAKKLHIPMLGICRGLSN